MKNLNDLLINITTLYKQKVFGKFLQEIGKNDFFSYSKNTYFILNDESQLIILYSTYLSIKYIYKDVDLTVLNFLNESNLNINCFNDKNIKFIKMNKKESDFKNILEFLKFKKLNIKNLSFILPDIFDEEITYIMYKILHKGKLEALKPIERHARYFIFRPALLLKKRDLTSICHKYDLKEELFSSFTFKDMNKEELFDVDKLINKIKESQNQADSNIYDAVNNVILDKVISYKKNGKFHSFEDIYKSLKK